MQARSKTKRDSRHTQADPESTDIIRTLKSSIKGGALGLFISVVLATLMCAVAYASPNPDALLSPLALAALYLSAFCAGAISARINGSSSLLCGIFSGGLFMLAYMLVSLFFPAELSAKYGFFVSFLFHSLIILMSILGGYAGQKRAKKSHKPKR